jgi:hypothetical protein
MTGRTETERILDAFLAPEADQLPDRVLDAAFDQIARSPQRRALRVPWRFPRMPVSTRLVAAAVVGVVALGVIYMNLPSRGGVGNSSPSPSPSPTAVPSPSVSPSAPAFTHDISKWTAYTSAIYGFTTAYPAGWKIEHAATRAWDPAVDVILGDDGAAVDVFTNAKGDVAFSMWRIPADVEAFADSRAALIAWVEATCSAAANLRPCDGIAARAIPMCREAANCHPDAVIVPFSGDTFAFFGGAEGALTVAQVWRVDADPEVAEYGGAVRLLQDFLKTVNVTVPGPGQG